MVGINALAAALDREGIALFLVGGAVRDMILERDVHDIDVCGQAGVEQMLEAAANQGIGAAVINRELGTLKLKLPSCEEGVEYTPFRAERYAPGGMHRPESIELGVSMDEDARRRDFTAGAIYMRVADGKLFDPLGGMDDVKARVLRITSPDTFEHDGLRLLRLVRMAGELGFSVEEQTLVSAAQMRGNLADIVPERKQEELTRILLADAKSPRGHARALALITSLHLWDYLIPPLLEGEGFEQNTRYHAHDVMQHNIYACVCAPNHLELRLAALLHDLGKPACAKANGNMYDHARISARMAHEVLGENGLRYPKKMVERVEKLIDCHMFDLKYDARHNTLRKRFVRWGLPFSRELCMLRAADIMGSGKYKHPALPLPPSWLKAIGELERDGTPLTLSELKINGSDLRRLGYEGPAIGKKLDELWTQAICDPALNDRDKLLGMAVKRR